MAAGASFSVSHENGQYLQAPKTYIYTRFQGNSEKKVLQKIGRQVAAILIISGKLKF